MVSLRPVTSSSIAAIGFDPDLSVLHVRFRSGALYRYWGVPASTHAAFIAAPSKGRFFMDQVRDRYPHTRAG